MAGNDSPAPETSKNLPARTDSNQLERQIAGLLDALQRELGPDVPADLVAALGRYHADRLLAEATITDYFIPQLVYRATKDDLLRRDTLEQAALAAA
jgi:hypothetical protein